MGQSSTLSTQKQTKNRDKRGAIKLDLLRKKKYSYQHDFASPFLSVLHLFYFGCSTIQIIGKYSGPISYIKRCSLLSEIWKKSKYKVYSKVVSLKVEVLDRVEHLKGRNNNSRDKGV